MRRFASILTILFGALLRCSSAWATPVQIPLRIDYLILGQALKEQAYTSPGGRADIWSGANPCEYFYATNPRFGRNGSEVSLETDGNLSIGVPVGTACISPVRWSGIIELDATPYLTPGLALKFRVVNVNLYNPQHQKTILVGRGFDVIKGYLIPRFEDFSFDLKPGLTQLEDLVQEAATPDVASRVKVALATLRPVKTVAVENDAVRLTLEMDVPTVSTTSPLMTGPAPPLTPAQVAAWQHELDNWDAFLVFAIKQLGLTVNDPQIRQQLFNLLIDSRHRLLVALAKPENLNTGPDPVRILFLQVWTQLATIVRTAAQRGLLQSRLPEFLSFISAGDALFALDQAAPALGMRISANDLRRLARIMAPQTTENPLAYSFDEDRQLRQLFGLTEPAETPGPLEVPATPSVAAPSPLPTPSSPATGSPLSMIGRLIGLLAPEEALAANDSRVSEIENLGESLRLVTVNQTNMAPYQQKIRRLLTLTAQAQLQNGVRDASEQGTYLLLVKSVAWQESCWRQFVERNGHVRYLESSTGDIGLMQVNKYVWRGLFKLPRLEWDIVYNAGAGEEILTKLMLSALDRNLERRGGPDALARSIYAAYNGGPAAYNRWRRPEPPLTREIDLSFWKKYRAVKDNQGFDIMTCAASWGHLH